MGLSSITNRMAYAGDGSSAVFPFPYYFFHTNDLAVYLYDTGSSVIYPQSLGTNYSVGGYVTQQGVYPNGGNVIMNSAFPSNLDLVITRNPALTQIFTLSQNAPINALAITQQFDYLTALTQSLQDQVSRAVQLPNGLGPFNGSTFSTVLPQNISLPSMGGSPLVLNSGATGWTFGLVAIGASGAVSYLGTLPVINGGTGNNTPLNPFGVMYGASATQMGETAAGSFPQVLLAQNSSAPTWGLTIIGSGAVQSQSVTGILPTFSGGTGTGSSSFYPQFGLIYSSSSTQFGSIPMAASGLVLTANASSFPTFQQFSLGSSAFVGVLPIINGGTGVPSFLSQTGLVVASSASQLSQVPQAASGLVLTSLASSNPTFQQISLGSSAAIIGVLPVANGGSGVSSFNPLGVIVASSATQHSQVPQTAAGLILTAVASSNPTFQQINLGTSPGLTGTLPVANGGTGQITFPPGNVIFGSGVSSLASLGGATGQVLTFQGSSAPIAQSIGQTLTPPSFTVFTTGSNTLTVPAGAQSVWVRMVGGGGSGGCTVPPGAAAAAAAGGGGGGGYAEKFITGGNLASSFVCSVGTAGVVVSGSTASNGGTTWFSLLVGSTSASGGNAATGGVTAGGTALVFMGGGGSGGTGANGDVNIKGSPGLIGINLANNQVLSGQGGASVLGGGALAQQGSGNGSNGGNYGGGGSGGTSNANAPGATGGSGAGGLIIAQIFFQ